jgi:polyisoprenyl-phosphate glycosyltransferase
MGSEVGTGEPLLTTKGDDVRLSVVLPAYQEAAVLPTLLPRLLATLERLDVDWEIVVVDDGSTDETWSVLGAATGEDSRIRALRLSRNFGHQAALSAGLSVARGDAVITMDSDLQHPPEIIPLLLAKGLEGNDVVYAVRSPVDSANWFKRGSATLFYRLLNRLTALDLPEGAADFRFMSRRVVDAILTMPERNRFLRGMTRWVGFSQATVTYDRALRAAGKSKYTYRRMLAFGWDAMTAFSSFPLRIASSLGATASFIGLAYLAYVLFIRFFSDAAVPGWTSVTAAVILLSGVQLICFGLMGQYIGRIYDEAKGRPIFIVADDTATRNQSDAPAEAFLGHPRNTEKEPTEKAPAVIRGSTSR